MLRTPRVDVGAVEGLRYRRVGRVGPTVVLLHGYAAPADDLLPLAEALTSRRSVRAVLPAGPVDFFGAVRAWFAIDTERHFAAMQADQHERLLDDAPAGLALARRRLLRFMGGLRRGLGGPPPVLVGFSQGAMMAADLALRTGVALSGLGLVCGGGVAAGPWPKLARHRGGLPALVAHGVDDPVLPARLGVRVADWLQVGGLDVERRLFPGGHEAGPALDDLVALLDRAFGPGLAPGGGSSYRRAAGTGTLRAR